MGVLIELGKAQIGLTKEQERQIGVDLVRKWEELKVARDANRIKQTGNKIENKRVEYDRWAKEVKASYPTLNESAGHIIEAIYNMLDWIGGSEHGTRDRRKRMK